MKRIISIILTVIFVLCGIGAFATETNSISNTYFDYKVLNVLSVLELIHPNMMIGDFNPEKQVNRGEFAAYIVYYLGVEEFYSATDMVFTDVPSSHPYAKQISIATDYGLLSGIGDGTFAPDEPVLYEQCVKVIINVLGYEMLAENSGGYPVGHLIQGKNISLTRGISISGDIPMNQGVIAQLLYNAMFIDVLSQSGYGNITNYQAVRGRTLLSEFRDIYRTTGLVTSNDITALFGSATVTKGHVRIDTEVYEEGSSSGGDWLGYNVTTFYKSVEDEGEKTLLYVHPTEGRNEELIINTDDIISYERHHYKYYDEGGRIASARFSGSTDVIFNGKSLASNPDEFNFEEVDFCPMIGEVKLLNSAENGNFNVLFITSYETLVVDSVDLSRNIIMAKEDITRNISLGKHNDISYTLVSEQGYDVPLEMLKEWDVLSVAKSLDHTFYTILLSERQITGTIDTVILSEDGVFVDRLWIDGVPYDVSKDFLGNTTLLQITTNGTFCIDIFGKISIVSTSRQAGLQYGYLRKAAISTTGLSNNINLKILTLENEIIEVSTANRMTVDGDASVRDIQTILNRFKNEDGIINPQPIKYQLNSKNEVSRIETVGGSSIRLLRPPSTEGTEKYWAVSATFESRVMVSPDAVVLMAPMPNDDTADDKDYIFKRRTALLNNTRYRYTVYNSDPESDAADFVLILNPSTMAPAEQSIALVDRIYSAVNGNGETVQRIVLLHGGAEVTRDAAVDSNVFDNAQEENNPEKKHKVEQGDVIRFSTNQSGAIVNVMMIYKRSLGSFSGNFRGSMDSQHRTVFGSVYDKTSDLVKLCRDISTFSSDFDIESFSNIEYHAYKSFAIYVYDKDAAKKVQVGTHEDIISYVHGGENFSKVLVQTRNGIPDTIVVYR